MPAIILELKAFHSAENALSQIKNKNYMKEAENYKEIILVGINYDKENIIHVLQKNTVNRLYILLFFKKTH